MTLVNYQPQHQFHVLYLAELWFVPNEVIYCVGQVSLLRAAITVESPTNSSASTEVSLKEYFTSTCQNDHQHAKGLPQHGKTSSNKAKLYIF